MNRFKGKKYYISIGYIDPDEHPDKDAKFIESIIVNHKEGSYGRVFHDEENDILLPIMPISEIQKKGTEIIFKYLFFPFKARFIKGDNKLLRYNTFGLFELTDDCSLENILLIKFYESRVQYDLKRSNTIIIKLDEKELEEK